METKCCGTCKWYEYDCAEIDRYCDNVFSDWCGEFTGYNQECERWEKRT